MFRKIGAAGLSAFLVWVSLGASSCSAQGSASATAFVTVSVVPGISVTNETSLNFGRLAKGSGIHTISSDATGVGSFTVSGMPDASVSLTFPHDITLQSPDGHLLAMAPTIPVCSVEVPQSGNQQLSLAVTGGSASLGSDGVLHVRFGGTVDTDHAELGFYSGQYTVTVVY